MPGGARRGNVKCGESEILMASPHVQLFHIKSNDAALDPGA